MNAPAVEIPIPGGAFLIAVCPTNLVVRVWLDVWRDELQAVAFMKSVDPLPVQFGQHFPVLGQGQHVGLEPPPLRRKSRF